MHPEVLYFTGWGRSGSTLLTNLLGELDSYFCAGELAAISEPGMLCGCGEAVVACPFWRPILDGVEAATGPLDMPELKRMRLAQAPPRRVPGMLLQRTLTPEQRHLAARFDALYAGMARTTGARVIVDNSKDPGLAALLARTLERMAFVHLVRDPRASAYSWAKNPHGGLPRFGLAHSSLRWLEWNGFGDLAIRRHRHLRVRYEDFVADPRAVLRAITAVAGTGTVPDDLVVDGAVRIGPNHTVGGNPGRFRTGMVSLKADEAWRDGLSAAERKLVTALALPLLHRYGYAIST
jgi:Sulfotransferase family